MAIQIIVGSLSLFSIGTIFYNIFHCGPFKSFTDFLFRKVARQCAPDEVTLAITYTHAGLTTLTDWTFALMPVLILRASLMTGKDKVVVGSLMGFASVSGVASLVRFKFVESIVEPTEEVFGALVLSLIPYYSPNLTGSCHGESGDLVLHRSWRGDHRSKHSLSSSFITSGIYSLWQQISFFFFLVKCAL
jgi:hypothetical protein